MGTGAQFDNIGTGHATPGTPIIIFLLMFVADVIKGYSLGSSMIMLVVDTVLYTIIAWYLDSVIAEYVYHIHVATLTLCYLFFLVFSEDSIALDPLFIFRPSYWFPRSSSPDEATRTLFLYPYLFADTPYSHSEQCVQLKIPRHRRLHRRRDHQPEQDLPARQPFPLERVRHRP